MDSFELEGLIILLASITTWVSLWTARASDNLGDVPFEIICTAIAWIAAAILTLVLIG